MHVYKNHDEHQTGDNQAGKVIVKFFWWPLIISVVLSIFLTLIVNIIF
jgi:hypothetical protein